MRRTAASSAWFEASVTHFGILGLCSTHEVQEMVRLLLNDIGFGAIFLVQESVASAMGSGLTSACVVDIGHDKTSISCVEEGVCLRNTRYVYHHHLADCSLCRRLTPSTSCTAGCTSTTAAEILNAPYSICSLRVAGSTGRAHAPDEILPRRRGHRGLCRARACDRRRHQTRPGRHRSGTSDAT